MGDVAGVFHFAPDALWSMEVEELLEWHRQARRVSGAK